MNKSLKIGGLYRVKSNLIWLFSEENLTINNSVICLSEPDWNNEYNICMDLISHQTIAVHFDEVDELISEDSNEL